MIDLQANSLLRAWINIHTIGLIISNVKVNKINKKHNVKITVNLIRD